MNQTFHTLNLCYRIRQWCQWCYTYFYFASKQNNLYNIFLWSLWPYVNGNRWLWFDLLESCRGTLKISSAKRRMLQNQQNQHRYEEIQLDGLCNISAASFSLPFSGVLEYNTNGINMFLVKNLLKMSEKPQMKTDLFRGN